METYIYKYIYKSNYRGDKYSKKHIYGKIYLQKNKHIEGSTQRGILIRENIRGGEITQT